VPVDNFTIGHDISVDIYDASTGNVVTFPAMTSFDRQPIFKQINSEPLNGYPIFAEAPNGWKGSIEFDRTDPTIDNYFAAQEASYFNGGNPLTASITETIQEKDGSVSQYRYPGAALKPDDMGRAVSATKMTIKMSWMASTRLQVV